MRLVIAAFASVLFSTTSHSQVWDIDTDWSETANPNGAWSLIEGSNALPHVSAWQQNLGGWAQPQPAWAESQDGNNRLPVFFSSNGSEVFTHDWIAGDLVVHSTDGSNGVGNGEASVRWTSPITGYVRVTGEVWQGRDIGRSNTWFVVKNGGFLTNGSLSDGDPYSSANPFDLADGSAGPGVLNVVQVQAGDTIDLRIVRTSVSGDFVVFRLRIEDIGCPPDLDNDQVVGFGDLNIVLGSYNQEGIGLSGDIDGDGDVDFADLNLVLSAFNHPCPVGSAAK